MNFKRGEIMVLWICIGITAFLVMLASDFLGLGKLHLLQSIVFYFGILILILAAVAIITLEINMSTSIGLTIVYALLTLFFLILTVYSVAIEVHSSTDEYTLVTNGTYTLSRHPGVLWLFLAFVCSSLLFGSSSLLYAGYTWTLVNIVYVIVQELCIFKKIFKGYHEYTKETPMIFPTIYSVTKWVNNILGGKNEKLT
jgi:protein-S-isoprenylcysteine O-methyltransferase Ste14